jgi:acetylornithine deacetylase/succinyl-diaminopimelate desuccinylase-like protein
MTSDGGRTAELLSALIRNACVNLDTPESGHERRNAEVLATVLPTDLLAWAHPDGLPERASLVARLEGTDPAAPTLLLLGHTDVVPVNPARWNRDPFGGEIVDGEVWGRGAVDMLNQTAAMALAFADLAAGPSRLPGTLIFAAVPDEEAGGDLGVLHLLDRHPELIRCDAVLTEAGGTVVATERGPVLGMAVGEKGMAPTRIVVHGRAAHGSTPRAGVNALVTAAEVVRRLDTARPPTVIGAEWRDWVDASVDDPALRARLLDVDHLWDDLDHLPPEQRVHAHSCTHTTYTPTEVRGGLKSNIVPDEITLGLDVRTVPGETSDDVQRFLDDLLGDLPVTITILHRTEPTRSDRATPVWSSLERAVQHAHPGGRVAPTLFTGATDGRHLRALGVPAFGFGVLSAALDPTTYWSRFHGDDERIDIESLRLSTDAWRHVALDFLG